MSSERIGRFAPLCAVLPIAALLLASCGAEASTKGTNARSLPDVVLQDQHGADVRFYADVVAGRSVVVQFFYTRCDGVCPAATESLCAVQDRVTDLRDRVRFVSISLDERDTPQDLADYARSRGMHDEWILLRGDRAAIESLRTALGARDPDPEVDAVRSNHSAGLVLGNDLVDRWTMVSGLGSPAAIERSIRRLVQ